MPTTPSTTACQCGTCGYCRAARLGARRGNIVQPDLELVAVPRDESFKVWSHGYGLRQIIEVQAAAGAPIERVTISGGAGRLDLVRQLLADTTGKPVLATEADEPVLLGAAILGGVAGGQFANVRSAMRSMSQISTTYEPAAGDLAALHETRFQAFTQLQTVARAIR